MIYPKIPLAQSIIQICLAQGVKYIVISPGSRNAPLTIGFANNPGFKCYSIADERCAGFFALGMAQQLKEPVALVCTSGSALLNYYPAVAEAFYSQIPLVVISADRPHDKIDIGDGQTIRQENVYANHILYSANLTEEAGERNDKKMNEALLKAITQKGPVHINAPFEEPLYETVDAVTVTPFVQEITVVEDALTADITPFAAKWNAAQKKLVLVGVDDPDTLPAFLIEKLAADPSVVVMTETTSNLHHESFIDNIDTIITPFTDKDFLALKPEILLTFGGMVVSKRIKAWLRGYAPAAHWHADPLRAYDTYGALTQHIEAEPAVFLSELLQNTQPVSSDYSNTFQHIRALRQQKHDEYLAKIPFSDFKAFQIIIPQLPENSHLQISNSAAIRYAQLFSIKPSVAVFCNRGTSGIDGSTSTAVGAAVASGIPTTLITGDISFFYDSNALWNNYIPKNFRIILINNGGGGIFRILPGHSENAVFNTYFETEHTLTAEHLATMYGFGYTAVKDQAGLASAMQHFFKESAQPQLLEVFTPTKDNDKILKAYFKELV
jgi:2-succinyl-5-enolpyruvyl-6-hydroxy-3-cyclohexene-1-carboxylate synthase